MNYLAIALGKMADFLNPEMIVLGGGISKQEDFLLSSLRKLVTKITPVPPKIVVSKLWDSTGLMSAAAIILNQVKQKLFRIYT